MSHEIPVFTCTIDSGLIPQGGLSYDEALTLIRQEWWMSTSRNWWWQELVKTLCDLYSGFDELRYLTQVVAVVPPDQMHKMVDAIHRLIAVINSDTEPFVAATPWYGATVDEVRQYISQAQVSRDLSDDSRYAFGNFFSFLVSQAAALEDAKASGQCLLYVQPQP